MTNEELSSPADLENAEGSAAISRRSLLAGAGVLGAAALGGIAMPSTAGAASAPPFRTAVFPNYFPREGQAPEVGLSGKVAVITGASRGIGLATAQALQGLGVTVIGTSRSPGNYPGVGVDLLELDVASHSSVQGFAAALSTQLAGDTIDILINNAGRYLLGTQTPIAPAFADSYMDAIELGSRTLYSGHIDVTNHLLGMMTSSGYARLLYTVSVAGYYTGGGATGAGLGFSFLHSYNAEKAALRTYANNLRGFLGLSGSNIQVSTVNPLIINTALPTGLNPIYTEPVDGSGNSVLNPTFQNGLTLLRAAQAGGLPPSLVADAYVELLSMASPPPNVVAGSGVEPLATQGGSDIFGTALLEDNAESALPFGASGPPGGN